MGVQFVQKEDEKVLERLALEQGLSKSEIIHRALSDYSEPQVDLPFNPSDIAGLAQDIKGKPTPKGSNVFTREGAIKRIAWMRQNGYTEQQISERASKWVIA